jgi:peptide/nickel transport system substrate-binding protein
MDISGYESFQIDPDAGTNFSWDPQATWAAEPFEVFRCCLLRTLLSYNGHSVRGGGAELRPDLAADLPTISADGLTWTFRIKTGIHYAPPMADKEVVAGDFVRALERALRPDPLKLNTDGYTPYGPYLSNVIAGASEFTQGTAASISGLETPDDHTLVVHLVQPTGDLGARLALPAATPIPPGAADGHDKGYGPYLVATGPYMIEGSDQLNPALPADQQPTVAGYVPGDHLYLVRNPSWDRATDPLRTAFADRIEISNVGDYDVVLAGIQGNQLDVSISTQLDNTDVARLRGDSSAAQRVHVAPGLTSRYIDMNLAVPPFDDIHVRRAIELVTNKKALLDLLAPGSAPQTHAIPDAFENGLLTDYDPFATPGSAGSLDAAKAEMAQSAYDTNHDGICDSPVCDHIHVPVPNEQPENLAAAQDFATELAAIGLQLDLDSVSFGDAYGYSVDPTNHAPLAFATGWNSDYFSATAWYEPQATGDQIGAETGSNLSLIGATPAQLSQYGYTVTAVPSLDNDIATCTGMSGHDAFACWSGVDQYLMERVVAWVPLANQQVASLTSTSVTAFDFDASLGLPALSQIEVAH